jgi:hypothetical protein
VLSAQSLASPSATFDARFATFDAKFAAIAASLAANSTATEVKSRVNKN